MNPIVADATAELADLAYDLYAEALDDLRALRIVGLEVIDTFDQLSRSTGGFEGEALSLALCDYLANAPMRSREDFRLFIVGRDA
jgi:hypothetical protein